MDGLSLSLNKERMKESQPKGLMPLGNSQKSLLFAPAARVVCLEAPHERYLCLSLDVLCSAAIAGGIQGGMPWLIFFRPFFVQRQRKGMNRNPRTREAV
jgi:hypothetical protein